MLFVPCPQIWLIEEGIGVCSCFEKVSWWPALMPSKMLIWSVQTLSRKSRTLSFSGELFTCLPKLGKQQRLFSINHSEKYFHFFWTSTTMIIYNSELIHYMSITWFLDLWLKLQTHRDTETGDIFDDIFEHIFITYNSCASVPSSANVFSPSWYICHGFVCFLKCLEVEAWFMSKRNAGWRQMHFLVGFHFRPVTKRLISWTKEGRGVGGCGSHTSCDPPATISITRSLSVSFLGDVSF